MATNEKPSASAPSTVSKPVDPTEQDEGQRQSASRNWRA